MKLISNNENHAIHPRVKTWLLQHNYAISYEHVLSDKRRVDFIAVQRATGSILVIECKGIKALGNGRNRIIEQINHYFNTFACPSATKLLALYPRIINKEFLLKMQSNSIKFIVVPTHNYHESSPFREQSGEYLHHENTHVWMTSYRYEWVDDQWVRKETK